MRATEGNRPSPKRQPENDLEYDAYVDRIQDRLLKRTRDFGPLFTTDAEGLFDLYLSSLPEHLRQHHTCRECRYFFEQFGGLAVVNPLNGALVSAFWALDDAPGIYEAAAFNLSRNVEQARITGVFYHDDPALGRDQTNGWHHMHLYVPFGALSTHKASLTPDQAAAEKKEDRKNVLRALQEYKRAHLEEAVRLKPGLVEAHCSLAVDYAATGRWEAAISQWEIAARLNPASTAIRDNLEKLKARRQQ